MCISDAIKLVLLSTLKIENYSKSHLQGWSHFSTHNVEKTTPHERWLLPPLQNHHYRWNNPTFMVGAYILERVRTLQGHRWSQNSTLRYQIGWKFPPFTLTNLLLTITQRYSHFVSCWITDMLKARIHSLTTGVTRRKFGLFHHVEIARNCTNTILTK